MRIASLATNLFEDSELTEPTRALEQAGHTVDVIAPRKEAISGYHGRAKVLPDAAIDDVDPQEFDALFVPGGFSPDQLRAFEQVVQRLSTFSHTGEEPWVPHAAVLSTSAVRPDVAGPAELCAWPETIHLGPNESPSPVPTDRHWTLTGAQFVVIELFLASCHRENKARLVLLDRTAVEARLRVALPHEDPLR